MLSFIYGAICNAICENAVVYFVVDNDYNVASINRMLLLLYSSLWHTEENKKDTSLFRSPNPPLMDKIKLIYKNRKVSILFFNVVVCSFCHSLVVNVH